MRNFNIAFLFLSMLIVSCSSDEFEVHELGDNLIDHTTSVRLIDTLTIKSSTVILDSVPTSGSQALMIGKYSDPFLGDVSSVGYTRVGYTHYMLESTSEPVLDSIRFITQYTGSYFGDTLVPVNISFHKLKNEVKVYDHEFKIDDGGRFYNNRTLEYFEENIGEHEFMLRPFRKDKEDSTKPYEVSIPLSEDFGNELLQLAINNPKADYSTNEEAIKWEENFHGLAFIVNDADCIFSFNLNRGTSKIRVYYRETRGNEDDEVKYHDYSIYGDRYNFTNITSDKLGSELEELTEMEVDLPPVDMNGLKDLTFIQGGIGLATKIEIPYIKNILRDGVTGGLLKADLVVYPAPMTFNDETTPLPTRLGLYFTDKTNKYLGLSATKGAPFVYGSISYDRNYVEETHYTFDLTSYISTVLLDPTIADENSLLISLPYTEIGLGVSRMIISNDKKSDFDIKLNLTYVVQQ